MQIGNPIHRPVAVAAAALARAFRLRGTDRVLRLLFNPDRQGPFAFERPFFGHTYRGDVARRLDWHVYFYGVYEHDDVETMRRILKRLDRPVAFDIGANMGHHLLAMSALCEAVHAFEPYPPARAVLERRVRENGIANATVHPFGLGNENGEHAFEAAPDIGMGRFTTDGAGSRLMMRRGDDLELGRVDFIKIDTEGHELEVLSGLRRSLEAWRPILMIEMNHPGANWSSFLPDDYVFVQNRRRSPLRTAQTPRVVETPVTGNFFALPREKAGLAAWDEMAPPAGHGPSSTTAASLRP